VGAEKIAFDPLSAAVCLASAKVDLSAGILITNDAHDSSSSVVFVQVNKRPIICRCAARRQSPCAAAEGPEAFSRRIHELWFACEGAPGALRLEAIVAGERGLCSRAR
jgi:hypothetical protein